MCLVEPTCGGRPLIMLGHTCLNSLAIVTHVLSTVMENIKSIHVD